MSGIDLRPGDPSYEARERGCTCTWMRGFLNDGPDTIEWVEWIIDYDAECPDPSHAERSEKRC